MRLTVAALIRTEPSGQNGESVSNQTKSGDSSSPPFLVHAVLFTRYVVTAPSDADETSLAYFAITPVV